MLTVSSAKPSPDCSCGKGGRLRSGLSGCCKFISSGAAGSSRSFASYALAGSNFGTGGSCACGLLTSSSRGPNCGTGGRCQSELDDVAGRGSCGSWESCNTESQFDSLMFEATMATHGVALHRFPTAATSFVIAASNP